MSFIENIAKKLSIDLGITPLKYRAVVFGERGVFIENVKSIISFSKQEILIRLKKGEVLLKGEHLSIKNYTGIDLFIEGSIKEFFVR